MGGGDREGLTPMSADSPAPQVRPGDFGAVFSFLDAATPAASVCMYCGMVMSPGREPASHGVCQECKPRARSEFLTPKGDR